MVDYISIPTGRYQYLQLGYFLLCITVNKKMIFIIITIIIIIIITMNSGALLLGLPKSIYYHWNSSYWGSILSSVLDTTSSTSKQGLVTSLHISPGNCLKNCWTYPAQPHYSNYLQERTYKSVIMSHKNKMGIRYLSMCCLYLLKSFWKGILFTVGYVDRDIGRYSSRHSSLCSGRQLVDTQSKVGRHSGR